MLTSQQLIQQYALQPHPEGGWYKETYKSNEYIPHTALPEDSEVQESFQSLFIFYCYRGIFLRFIVSKLMNAGIFMQVILCLYM